MTRRMVFITCFVLLFLVLAVWIWWCNQALTLNTYTVKSKDLPSAFDGFRIAHVSDLHNTQIGRNNTELLSLLRNAQPDVIAITGDLVDSRRTDFDIALQFAAEAVVIAPCYYVPGNHEARIAGYETLKASLVKLGVIVLEDACTDLTHGGETITLAGVADPSFKTDYLFGDAASVMEETLNKLLSGSDGFRLLLSHRPELYQVYTSSGLDLVLSGHAHGGQFRFPLIGGLYAPNQGFFPKYDAGLFTDGKTNMIVSRGIGNSIIPFRFHNRPEVILIELNS